jgi:hypothetical protein
LVLRIIKGGEFNAELRNLQGTIIMKTNAMPCNPGWHKSNINLHDIPNGAYMLKLTCGDLKEVRKVIVNR